MQKSFVESCREKVDEMIVQCLEDTSGGEYSIEPLCDAIERYAQACVEAELLFARDNDFKFV